MKKLYVSLTILLVFSAILVFTSSSSKFSLFNKNEVAKSALDAPKSPAERDGGKVIGKNDTGQVTFYNTEASVNLQPDGGKVVINKGVDWYANIDPKLSTELSSGESATTEEAIFDPRDNSEVDEVVLKTLDYIASANSFMFRNPNAEKSLIMEQYKKAWGYAWLNNYALQAQVSDDKSLSVNDPQPTRALTLYNLKNKKYFCFIDSRYLGKKVNEPAFIDQVMIMESCGKFFGMKGFKE